MTRLSMLRMVTVPVLAGVLMAAFAMPASASTKGNNDPSNYLALGDSIPFGYNPFIAQPGVKPNLFVGYPELAAGVFRPMKRLANASCPGETSASFINISAPNNGCTPPDGYRAFAALHVAYSGSQLAYAQSYVKAHPRTGLISMTIGANDAGPLVAYCMGTFGDPNVQLACINAGLIGPYPDATIGNVLPQVAANLTTIYSSLIAAGFHGQLVAVTYYSTDYADPLPTEWLAAIDAVLAAVTMRFGGKVANAFSAFQAASAAFGGDACAAGLLIPVPGEPGSCNMHPSPAGAQLLAQTLRAAAS